MFHGFGYHNPHSYLSFRYRGFGYSRYGYLSDCDLRWTRYRTANCNSDSTSRDDTVTGGYIRGMASTPRAAQ